MKVKMVSYSAPTAEMVDVGIDGIPELIAFCARVSNPSNQHNTETTDKLIKYLLDHKHFSPFEMASICIEIETTRDIARQILRHRSFSFQEFSQRYADPTKDLAFVTREARLQDPKNRQNSISENVDVMVQYEWDTRQRNLINQAKTTYDWAISNGIAKEQARAVLPEGLTVSRLYMHGTIRSWIHYLQIRMHESGGTQKEHREIAVECAKAIAEIFPIINGLSVDVSAPTKLHKEPRVAICMMCEKADDQIEKCTDQCCEEKKLIKIDGFKGVSAV